MSSIPNTQLTHLGIFVNDPERMATFYTEMFGMVVSDQGEFMGKHLTFMTGTPREHHQIVLVKGRTGSPDTKILGQVSFRVDSLGHLRAFAARAEEVGGTELEARNHGNSWSVYFRDPEYNFIEMYVVSPWQVRQPWRVALDLSKSDADIVDETKRLIEAEDVMIPLEQWERDIKQRLAAHRGTPPPDSAPASGAARAPVEDFPSIWSALREVEFRQGFLEAGGVRTRYVEAGRPDAPAVVMLHGTGAHWETFARNLGPYGEHFRTVSFDMIGNGFSGRPDHDYEIPQYVDHALAVMDVLGIGRAHLLGTSLGSWIAAAIALRHPDRVDKMVLMSAAGLIASEENMQRIVATRMKAVENPDWDSIKAMFDHLLADERNRLPDLVSLRQAIYRQPGMIDTMRHTLVLQDTEVRNRNLLSEDEWRSIQHPTLTIASGKDYSEYSNTSRIVAELMPNARVAEMPEVKHWPHFEDAETFNRISLEFLLG